MTTRCTPRTSRAFAEMPSRPAAPTSAIAVSLPGQVTSSAAERPGSVRLPCARNAPRQIAASSSREPVVSLFGRPRIGRRRASSSPVWRARVSPPSSTRTRYWSCGACPRRDHRDVGAHAVDLAEVARHPPGDRAASRVPTRSAMRLEIMCSPPANRSIDGEFGGPHARSSTTSTRASSSLTSAVNATWSSLSSRSWSQARRAVTRGRGRGA